MDILPDKPGPRSLVARITVPFCPIMNACFVSVGFVNRIVLPVFTVSVIGGLIPVELDHRYALSTSITEISMWLAVVVGTF